MGFWIFVAIVFTVSTFCTFLFFELDERCGTTIIRQLFRTLWVLFGLLAIGTLSMMIAYHTLETGKNNDTSEVISYDERRPHPADD